MTPRKIATFDLILHGGKAPVWLISRMKKLGRAIISFIHYEYGPREILRRLADPIWFQAFSYVLGYDWNSSGVTTVVTGVLRDILTPEFDILVAGGKGKRSLQAPRDIKFIGETFRFSESKINELIRTSKLVAKVDNAVLQDGHSIYHHTMFVDKYGNWVIIQQGMNPNLKSARRYHWISEGLKSFVLDPHKGISGDLKMPFVLNMATKESLEAQKVCVDIVNEGIRRIKNDLGSIFRRFKRMPDILSIINQESWRAPTVMDNNPLREHIKISILRMRVNWKALEKAYELSPNSYENLIEIEGIGPGTIRALALIAELVYNTRVSWRDPLRYTFAVGGKDGVPYPVNIRRMEEVAEFLTQAIEEARIGKEEKIKALKRLSKLMPIK